MKVRDLLELLLSQDPDREVVIAGSQDASPLHGVYVAAYVPENSWSGDLYFEQLTDKLRQEGYTEDDLVDPDSDYQPALVLVPVN